MYILSTDTPFTYRRRKASSCIKTSEAKACKISQWWCLLQRTDPWPTQTSIAFARMLCRLAETPYPLSLVITDDEVLLPVHLQCGRSSMNSSSDAWCQHAVSPLRCSLIINRGMGLLFVCLQQECESIHAGFERAHPGPYSSRYMRQQHDLCTWNLRWSHVIYVDPAQPHDFVKRWQRTCTGQCCILFCWEYHPGKPFVRVLS